MWTLSQSHSVAEVRSDPWRPSSPTHLLKAGSARQVAQDHVQLGFKISNLSNNFVKV